jgi:Antirepressor regulating drug resistance, predicted signal transduction N-terminal membrane component
MTLFLLLFQKIVQLSFMGSLIVVSILLTKIIMKDRIGIRFQYAIWFILILRLLLPFTPSSSFSVYNYVPTNIPTYVSSDKSRMMSIPASYPSMDESSNTTFIERTERTTITYLVLAKKALPFLWISGVCMIGLVIFINNWLFLKRIKKCPRIKDQHVLSILNDCKNLMNISKDIFLVETNMDRTPCVLNFIKPIIMIPTKSLEECNLNHLKYVLLHELAHVKRKDIFINYIVSFLCIIYWFNPLIWFGFHKMREDREICCDSLTLSVLGEDEVTNYGFTIINFAEVSLRAPYLPAVAGIINKKSIMKRRIIMIKRFEKNSYRITSMALTVLLIAGIIFLTGEMKTDGNEDTSTKAETFGDASTQIIDGVNCTFVDDQDAIGKWDTVDFVKDIDDYVPNVTSWRGDLYLLNIKLLPNGEMPKIEVDSSDKIVVIDTSMFVTWTKGYIINHYNNTAGKYTIKEINGTKYMFWEWKSGDYIRSGMKPYYYVLKQAMA